MRIAPVAEHKIENFKDLYLEVLLSRDEVLNTFSGSNLQRLKSIAYEKAMAKIANEDYGKISIQSAVLVLAKILVRENKMDQLLQAADESEVALFLGTGSFGSDALLAKILALSQP